MEWLPCFMLKMQDSVSIITNGPLDEEELSEFIRRVLSSRERPAKPLTGASRN